MGVRVLLSVLLAAGVFGDAARFASGRSALAIPFDLDGDQIYVRVSVNGSPPLTFMLDTGASQSILSVRQAKSFGLALQHVGNVEGGLGAEAPPEAYVATDEVSFGLPGVMFSERRLVAVSLDKAQECIDKGSGPGTIIDGILGRGFFTTFVVEIDYPVRVLNLYEPATYRYRGEGKALPLEIDPDLVYVRTQVSAPGRAPVTARLIVDTGSATGLTLGKQFTDAHKLLPPPETLAPSVECGIGGSAEDTNLTGKLASIQLATHKVGDPLTVFRRKKTSQAADGLLGNPVLRNFKVVFDYSRRRMILERR